MVLIHKGWKWIRFIDISRFRVYRRDVRDLEKLHPCDLDPKSVARSMIRQRATFKRCKVPFRESAVKTATTKLREAKP